MRIDGREWLSRLKRIIFFFVLVGAPIFLRAQITTGEQPSSGIAEARFVRISEILISAPATQDDKEIIAAHQKAEQLRLQIQQGQDFAEIAEANSQGPSASQGGDVGYVSRGDLERPLEDVVFKLGVGEVSDVIRTKQGFLIIKITDRTDKATRPAVSNNRVGSTLPPELDAYKANLVGKIYSAWYQLIPAASQSKSGTVIILLSIGHDGSLRNPRIALGSGFEELDDAALKAAKISAPYTPLPETIKSDAITLRLRFQYNPTASSVN